MSQYINSFNFPLNFRASHSPETQYWFGVADEPISKKEAHVHSMHQSTRRYSHCLIITVCFRLMTTSECWSFLNLSYHPNTEWELSENSLCEGLIVQLKTNFPITQVPWRPNVDHFILSSSLNTFQIINHKFTIYYRGQLESSVAEEKRYNPRLSKDIDTFVEIMENLNLPKPKMIGKLEIFWVCFHEKWITITVQWGSGCFWSQSNPR